MLYAISVKYEAKSPEPLSVLETPVVVGKFPTSSASNFKFSAKAGALVFSDYVYTAIGGTVAFGPQDVMVVSSSMRRTVSVQTILGWLLSTVIIAVLLSLVT